MNRSKAMFYNLLLMTGVSLIMRFVSLSFNVYITGQIGAGGIGLYSLIMSVGGFAITLATSGVNLAATRMTAEASGRGSMSDIRRSMTRCIVYGLVFGVFAALLLFAVSKPVSLRLLADKRCILPLRLLCAALPFISLSSALSGYFTAVRRVYKSAVVAVLEQFITISVTVRLFALLLPRGSEYACVAVIGGAVISELSAFIASFILYRIDIRRHNDSSGANEKHLSRKLLSISLPVAASSYVRSGLVSVEHILIPFGLKKSGASAEAALASYGTLHGMVMPIILFPMAIVSSFSGLLVPEIAESIAAGEKQRVDNIVSRVFQITLAFSVGCAGIMLCYSGALGVLIYNSSEASLFIRTMAPLIPVMYLDHVVDGMLKGIGEQLYSMRVNIVDSALSVVLVYTLLPILGIYGYVIIIFAMEVLNASLSIARLLTRCNIRIEIVKWVVKPLVCVVGATSITKIIMALDSFCCMGFRVNAICGICMSVILYILLLRATFSFSGDDVKWFVNAVK